MTATAREASRSLFTGDRPRVIGAIEFRVPAIPVAQPRQRTRIVEAKGRAFAHNYTPARHPVNEFKAAVKLAFNAVHHGPPLDGVVGLAVTFVLPRVGSLFWKRRPMPRCRRKCKVDWDNLAKSFCDALSGLAWRDDSQICSASVELWIAAGDEQPHVHARIWSLDQ